LDLFLEDPGNAGFTGNLWHGIAIMGIMACTQNVKAGEGV